MTDTGGLPGSSRKAKDEEPDPGNQTEGHAATVGTDDEAGEDNDDLERNKHGGSAFKRCERVITDSICDV